MFNSNKYTNTCTKCAWSAPREGIYSCINWSSNTNISKGAKYYSTGSSPDLRITSARLSKKYGVATLYYFNHLIDMKVPFYQARETAIRAYATKGKQRKGVSPKPNKPKGKSGIVPGQIGEAKFSFYAPFFHEKLHSKFTLSQIEDMISKTQLYHDSLIRNHGVKDGTSRWKTIWLYCNHLIEGRSPRVPDWTSIGKVDLWPTKLTFLRPVYHLLRDAKTSKTDTNLVSESLRFLLTLSKLNRIKSDFSELKVENLKSTFKLSPQLLSKFDKFVARKLSGARDKLSLDTLQAQPFFGPNKGPNKVPKNDSADAEAFALLYTSNPGVTEGLFLYCRETNNSEFLNYLSSRAGEYESLKFSDNIPTAEQRVELADKIVIRKLTSVPDSGNKSRTIAIVDWWTQSLLSSLENWVIKVTMELYSKNCCFYSHQKGWEVIQQMSDHKSLKSYDATDWTDNLPSSLQLITVKKLHSQLISLGWKNLAVSCEWTLDDGSTIKYGKGQGMGTKGSFAIAQLTDCLFIDFTYEELGAYIISPFWMKVGDDLVIEDPQDKFLVAYENIGVPINQNKSKLHTVYGSFVEFVSRNSWDGNDYSLISPSLLLQFRRNNYFAVTLLAHLSERGLHFTLEELLLIKEQHWAVARSDYDLADSAKRNHNILFLASLLVYAGQLDAKFVPNYLEVLNSISQEDCMNFMQKLVSFPAIQLLDFYNSKSKKESRETAIELEQLFIKMSNWEHSGTSIWEFSNNESMNVGSIEKLFKFRTLQKGKDQKLDTGYNTYLSGVTLNQFEPYLLRQIKSEPIREVNMVNPLFVQLMLNWLANVNEVITEHKRVMRLPITDKVNTKPLLELFNSLNKINNGEITLGSETNTNLILSLSKDKILELPAIQVESCISTLGLQSVWENVVQPLDYDINWIGKESLIDVPVTTDKSEDNGDQI